MRNEFTLAFNEVLEEKQLPRDVILRALESAMVSAYRRAVIASTAQHVEAKVDPETGQVTIMAEKEVVDSVQDDRTEVALEVAQKYDPNAEIGQMVIVDSTPNDFGRVAAQTARQVIQQRIRDAERQAQLAFYQRQLGEIVSGVVQAINSQGLTIGMEMRAEGYMARKDMIQGERFRIHERVRALVADVKDSSRGPQIILSRTHRDFLRRLLENEVPEIYHGVVEIRSIAREPGERAKVAVSAAQSGIDPVGACVGQRGVRIQAIVKELHEEKIDVIEWNSDPAVFIAKAISPARSSGVYLNEHSASGKTATVVVPEDQLSLAIGRDGQNARLAAKLTGWRIDIKSLSEAAADAIHKLTNDPAYQAVAEVESVHIPAMQIILTKKSEGRTILPEEYDQLAKFVDRVEKRIGRKVSERVEKVVDEETARIREGLPAGIFDQNILDSSLPEHVAYILQEAGYNTVGELAVQMRTHPDDVLRLQGIGPRAMTEIQRLMENVLAQAEAEKVSKPVAETVETVIAPKPIAEAIEAQAVITEAQVEEVLESAPSAEAQPGEIIEQAAPPAKEELVIEEEVSFDELFTLKPGIEPVITEEEEEEGEGEGSAGGKKGKKGKKKRKFVELEYDPDRDVTVAKKKHKHGEWDWEA